MLSALAIGPLAATFAMAATPVDASVDTAGIRPEFLEAHHRFLRMEAESDQYDRTVHQQAQDRFKVAAAAVPHTSVMVEGAKWSTADAGLVKTAQHIIAMPGQHRDVPEVRAMRRLVAAHLRRERAVSRLPERAAMKRTYAESERLTDAHIAAEDGFYLLHPASLPELVHKLRVMADRDRDWEGCVADIILPDVLALTSREA